MGIVSEYIRNLIAKQVDDNGIGKARGQALLFAILEKHVLNR